MLSKRDDETFDEFLSRITSDQHPIAFGAWSEETADIAMERMRDGRERDQK